MEIQTPAPQEFLTLDESAAFYRKSRHGFRKMLRTGKAPPPVRCGKTPLWHIDTLRQWLQSPAQQPRPQDATAQVVVLGTIMRDGISPQPDGTFKQATVQERLDAAKQLLKLVAPTVA